MKLSLHLLYALFLLTACAKFTDLREDNLFESADPSYIFGVLTLTDTLTQRTVETPLANKTIRLRYADSPDSANYIITASTNDKGQFHFKGIRQDRPYVLSYQEKIDGKWYSAIVSSSAPNDTCRLNAVLDQSLQSGVLFQITDSLAKPIAGAKICIFSSEEIFSHGNCDGSNFQLESNHYGRAFQFDIPSNAYYFRINHTINGVDYEATGQFHSNKSLISQKTILSKRATTPSKGLHVLTLDQAGNPLSGVQVCLFASATLFARDTCENSNYQMMSSPEGRAIFADIAERQYYIRANLTVGDEQYLVTDSIFVTGPQKQIILHFPLR